MDEIIEDEISLDEITRSCAFNIFEKIHKMFPLATNYTTWFNTLPSDEEWISYSGTVELAKYKIADLIAVFGKLTRGQNMGEKVNLTWNGDHLLLSGIKPEKGREHIRLSLGLDKLKAQDCAYVLLCDHKKYTIDCVIDGEQVMSLCGLQQCLSPYHLHIEDEATTKQRKRKCFSNADAVCSHDPKCERDNPIEIVEVTTTAPKRKQNFGAAEAVEVNSGKLLKRAIKKCKTARNYLDDACVLFEPKECNQEE